MAKSAPNRPWRPECTPTGLRRISVPPRASGRASGDLELGALIISEARRSVALDGKEIAVSRREFAILHALAERPGHVLSRSQLEDRIYGWQEEIESNAAAVLIHGIRKKLGAAVIKNIRGLGWMVDKCQ